MQKLLIQNAEQRQDRKEIEETKMWKLLIQNAERQDRKEIDETKM